MRRIESRLGRPRPGRCRTWPRRRNRMSSSRQIWCGAVGLLVLVAAMARLFIWPGYQEAAAIRRELGLLRAKMNSLQDANHQVQKLEQQVRDMRVQVARQYKM